jgi:oligoribonuclease
LLDGGLSIAEAEQRVLDYVRTLVAEPGKAPLAGNTIGTDRAFLAKYMTRVDSHLHYRSVDVSSIKELARRWFPRAYFQAPAKNGGHRALADILESIRELEYYRRVVFVQPPGPSSDEASTAAKAAVAQWAARVP